MKTSPSRAVRWALWLAVAAVLAAVFLSHLNPHLAVELANRVWTCFY